MLALAEDALTSDEDGLVQAEAAVVFVVAGGVAARRRPLGSLLALQTKEAAGSLLEMSQVGMIPGGP